VVLEAFPVFVYGLFWGLVDYIAKKEDSRDRYPTLIFISEWGGLLALYCVYKSLLKQYINSFFALFFIIFLLFSFVAIGAYVIKRYFSHFYILGEDKEELEKNTWQEMRDNVKLSLTTGIPLFIFLVVFIGECYNVALHFLKLEILGKDAMTHDAILMYLAHLYETSFFSYMIGFLISFFFARYAYVAFSIKRKIILIFLFLFLISFCCLFSHHAFIMIALSVLFKSFQRTSLFSLKENLLLFVGHSKRVAFKVFVESFAGRMGKFFMATLLAFMYGFFIKAQLFFYFVLFSSLAFVFLLSGLFFTRKKD
jgi:hypothetical protein